MKNLLLLPILTALSAQAADVCEYSDFNCDGKKENISYYESTLTITDGATGKKYTGSFNLDGGGVVKGYFPGTIVINADFESPSNPYIHQYTFLWNGLKRDWYLVKESNWTDESLAGKNIGRYPSEFTVVRYNCCISMDSVENDKSKRENKLGYRESIEDDFRYVNNLVKKKKFDGLFSINMENPKIIPIDFAYELTSIIDSSNVEDINNFAFYATKYNQPNPAIIILNGVIKKHPDRVVAYLNLADAYAKAHDFDSAKKLYREYVSIMREIGKEDKIPKRVFGAIK